MFSLPCRRLVSRAQCAKGCEGPLLATSRRLSSLGKRLLDGTAAAPSAAKVGALGTQGQAGEAHSGVLSILQPQAFPGA